MSGITISLQFGGGAELLFDKIKKREIQLPPLHKYLQQNQSERVEELIEHQTESNQNVTNKQKWTIRTLLQWLKENLLREREELFLQGATVRPGILVLVNDADWELLGELQYELQDGDTVLFISTLHGG